MCPHQLLELHSLTRGGSTQHRPQRDRTFSSLGCTGREMNRARPVVSQSLETWFHLGLHLHFLIFRAKVILMVYNWKLKQCC